MATTRHYPPNYGRTRARLHAVSQTEGHVVAHDVIFSSSQAIQAVPDLTYRMLDYWSRERILEPSVQAAGGSGVPRAYSFMDLVALRALVLLRRSGLTLRSLTEIAKFIQRIDVHTENIDEVRLLITSSEVTLIEANGHLLSTVLAQVASDEPMCLILDLGQIIRLLRGEIEGLLAPVV